MQLTHQLYYCMKPLLPRAVQLYLRRHRSILLKRQYKETWPIYEAAGIAPANWRGWPDKKRFALVLTHDVDTAYGNDHALNLMEIEKSMGFTSTFFFVPEEYKNPDKHHDELNRNGFEVGIHGLKHDGKLFNSKKKFLDNASRINSYIKKWGSVGFRAPCMHHNLEWMHALQVSYDASTYDIDPFEPQGGGMKTIFPFIVSNQTTKSSYVEIPYTLSQDFLLFVLLKEKTIDIWKKKLDWIVEKGGMAHIITHPDYMNFTNTPNNAGEKYNINLYIELLQYISNTYKDHYWPAQCRDIDAFMRKGA